MKWIANKKLIPLLVLVAVGGWLLFSTFVGGLDRTRMAEFNRSLHNVGFSPGPLSGSHAFLAKDCHACHAPNGGVPAASCIACHANNKTLLQNPPTAFHANLKSCVQCHVEHQGGNRAPSQMNHAALADMGMDELARNGVLGAARRDHIAAWVGQHSGHAALPPGHPTVTPQEAALNCFSCHATQDRHREKFGKSCIECHTTTEWNIPAFKHPSPTSTSCNQCHTAPPSHYMMHFKMVSQKVAGQESAAVRECYKCHQTTSWNDIKGKGWYKHH